jgi:hypothetical protein
MVEKLISVGELHLVAVVQWVSQPLGVLVACMAGAVPEQRSMKIRKSGDQRAFAALF